MSEFWSEFWIQQLEYLLRIVVAAVCGAFIGMERKRRLKGAGVRTHLIVALASALMTVVSKYGFFDVTVLDSVNLDPSRVAAGVVSAIGFLGAGVIFMRNQSVIGITTAAGIWATVGVGMAVGAGMYVVGVASAVIIVLVQLCLHHNFHLGTSTSAAEEHPISLVISNKRESVQSLQEQFERHGITLSEMKLEKDADHGRICVEAVAKLPKAYTAAELMFLLQESEYIDSVEL
jgi:putative Mg2+ transporter-C (MgtC) family protein